MKYNTINIVNTFFKINKIEVIIVVICVRKSRERELHVREVCNVYYTYGKTVMLKKKLVYVCMRVSVCMYA